MSALARFPVRLAQRVNRVRFRCIQGLAGVARRVEDGAVALTFDDGPHPSSTTRVLDVLAELEVRATFFCVGRNAQEHPGIVERALAEGHAVGSHSLTHPEPAEVRPGALARDYREGCRVVSSVAGRDIRLFRPPHGHVAVSSAVTLRQMRVRPWLWTVDPEDWRPRVTTEHLVSASATARSGDVILLHDWVEQPWSPEALDRSATIDALPAIVDGLRRRGLRFTTLSM